MASLARRNPAIQPRVTAAGRLAERLVRVIAAHNRAREQEARRQAARHIRFRGYRPEELKRFRVCRGDLPF